LNVLLLVPILNLVTTWASSKITRKLTYRPPTQQGSPDTSMKIMEITMPLMIFYMAFKLPAALGVYWIFQNVLGVAQQLVLKKMYPVPVFTEEDYKEEERRLRAKSRGRDRDMYKTAPDGKQYRSLHHIDDEPEETAVDNTQDNNTNKPAEGAPKLKDDKK
jgi:YidC/Oxa1 family membrane protein insertase